ncbi:MAG: ABC transporter substrate-binding protein [Chloroflexi bacterium]|nr:ABC transporter substrate-binding protein [Chloroflexota bacterium]
MTSKKQKLNIIYRAAVMLPVLNTIADQGLWSKYGLDPAITLVQNTKEAEEGLLSGSWHMIFGNHTSPYSLRMRGAPVVYVAQTLNREDRYLVARPEVSSVMQLRGKKYLGSEHGQHPELSERFHLRLAGIDVHQSGLVMSYLPRRSENKDKLEKLVSGEADLSILSPPWELLARRRGLTVLAETSLETINGITVLTTTKFAEQNEEGLLNVLKALSHGIHHYKTHREASIALLREHTKNKDLADDPEIMERHYQASSSVLTPALYPTAVSIQTVYQMALQEDPELRNLNPLEAWDLHYVRTLNESGFVAALSADS